jgi:hypothetical protein
VAAANPRALSPTATGHHRRHAVFFGAGALPVSNAAAVSDVRPLLPAE